jgi:hypothetical protein
MIMMMAPTRCHCNFFFAPCPLVFHKGGATAGLPIPTSVIVDQLVGERKLFPLGSAVAPLLVTSASEWNDLEFTLCPFSCMLGTVQTPKPAAAVRKYRVRACFADPDGSNGFAFQFRMENGNSAEFEFLDQPLYEIKDGVRGVQCVRSAYVEFTPETVHNYGGHGIASVRVPSGMFPSRVF